MDLNLINTIDNIYILYLFSRRLGKRVNLLNWKYFDWKRALDLYGIVATQKTRKEEPFLGIDVLHSKW